MSRFYNWDDFVLYSEITARLKRIDLETSRGWSVDNLRTIPVWQGNEASIEFKEMSSRARLKSAFWGIAEAEELLPVLKEHPDMLSGLLNFPATIMRSREGWLGYPALNNYGDEWKLSLEKLHTYSLCGGVFVQVYK